MGCPVVAIFAVQFVTNCWGFSVSPWQATSSPLHGRVRSVIQGSGGLGDRCSTNGRSIRLRSQLFASRSSPPLPSTDDPFELLGLDPRNPTTDAKEIKRAYRKRAMQYHPDVLTGPDSTEKERDEASKNFARINGAYEMLTGGNKGSNSSSSSSSSSTSSGAYSAYNKPPHRRQSNASSGNYRSTNWEDFMPNYDDEDAKYDADGDSFGSIFSDVLTGAAGYASGVAGGGGGIVGDFIEFLENMDGFQSGYDDDKTLRDLIAFGSYDEVSSEMDECDILVSSLETKLSAVENELIQAQADLNAATRYSEKLDVEERIAELKAREKVVKGYVKKTKKRLISLRERYKEMVVDGRGGRGYGSSSTSSRSSQPSYSDSAYIPPQPSYSPPAASPTPSPSSRTRGSTSSGSTSSNSWRNEGFSGGRRSSSSRSSRRGRERQTGNTSNQQQQQSSSGPSRSGGYSSTSSNRSTSSSGSGSAQSTPRKYEPYVPPHRRSRSSVDTAAQDKKRLRELEVDDEFDKLKREMGM